MTAPKYKWQPTSTEIAARFGMKAEDVIRFDQNTSPLSTEWATSIASQVAEGLNNYPGASYVSLREAAADYLGVDREMIVPGAGVDEIISIVGRAFLGSAMRSTAVTPTYTMYEIVTKQRQGEFVGVSYKEDFEFPIKEFSRAARRSEVTWLCVPNNPTGERVDDELIEEVISSSKAVVVIDAAYGEFVGDNWAPWIERYDNLIVTHTMSKAFGLAGARVGFSISSPEIATALDSVRPPGSISSLSAKLAETALANSQYMRENTERIITERERLALALTELGIEPRDSAANFLLSYVGSGARNVADSLMAEGLVIRSFPEDHPLVNYLRFTVRTPREDDRLIDALQRNLR